MKNRFQKIMVLTAAATAALTVLISVVYHNAPSDALFSLAVTFGVTCYHFSMRLLVGYTVNAAGKRIDPAARWFVPRKREAHLYRLLKLRKWKHHIPTYNPESFDLRLHTADELLRTGCVSEIVHEVIIVLSFLPMLLWIPFGSPLVFFLTSLGAALIDSVFVMLQRYNRPRLAKFIQRLK